MTAPRLADLERSFLRPARQDHDALAAQLGGGGQRGSELWARATASGRLPSGWSRDPLRRFRATAAELARAGLELAPSAGAGAGAGAGASAGTSVDGAVEAHRDPAGRAHYLTATPAAAQAALLLISDPAGMLRAEALARATVERLSPWGSPAPQRVAWRLAGNPVDLPRAGGPPLAALRPAVARLRAVLDGTGRSYEPPHLHRRFRFVADAFHDLRRWQQLSDYLLPAQIRGADGTLELPAAIVGRRLGDLANPFEPWLELIATGYWLWAVGDVASGRRDATLELAAPFLPPRTRPKQLFTHRNGHAQPRRFGRVAARESVEIVPRAVWSAQLAEARLACVRGEPGWVQRYLAELAGDDEAGQPRLLHFAVYGGPKVLKALAGAGHLDLEARDLAGRTALMLAAGLPREGPAGASPSEVDVPIDGLIGQASCGWLLHAGAKLEAQDFAGRTALHWSIAGANRHSAEVLLAAGAEVDARDHQGRTPLMLAPGRDESSKLVERLLSAGADPDARDAHGWTVLHYLASHIDRRGVKLAHLLVRRGAMPSRDRVGRAPADVVKALRGIRQPFPPPFDAQTAVAAGPPPPELLSDDDEGRALAGALADELVPLPGAAEAARPALSPHWMVWADWLQSRGDPRGELVALSLARARGSRKTRRRIEPELERLHARLRPWTHTGIWAADPSSLAGESSLELYRTHGFITRAVFRERWQPVQPLRHGIERVIPPLLKHEPLLAELTIRFRDPSRWAELLDDLRSLPPAPQLRRLQLAGLPPEPPDLLALSQALPQLRELSLVASSKLHTLRLRWPGIRRLRLRHGDTSEWTQGGVAIELDTPQLTHLDLAVPIGSRERDDEVRGLRSTLATLPASVVDLRLHPLAPAFATAMFESGVLRQLKRLELRPRGATLELLAAHSAELARPEGLVVCVSAPVAEQRDLVLAQLRQSLPRLELRVG